jgi:hypothetical protein
MRPGRYYRSLMYIELCTFDTLHKKTARRLLPGSRTTVIGAGICRILYLNFAEVLFHALR